jgi:crossover junction endodeoxyribonuclease RusA
MKAILELPHPPSNNVYYRRNMYSTYLSDAGHKFKSEVSDYVVENQIPKFGDARLRVKIILRPRSKARHDLDNYFKALLDALQDSGVYNDDSQIDYLEMSRGEVIKGGRIIISIEAIDDSTI